MQDAAKIQQQIEYQTTHQNTKAALVLEQIANIQRNKAMAEQELAKFRVLREGFNISQGVLNQQLTQIRGQEAPNQVSINAFVGALGNLEGLIKQADLAIAKNEGSFMAFSTMEQQYQQQMVDAQARQRVLAGQGGKAIELAARATVETVAGVEAGDTIVSVEATPVFDDSLEALIDAAAAVGEDPVQEPIAAPKQTPSPQRGGGRKKRR